MANQRAIFVVAVMTVIVLRLVLIIMSGSQDCALPIIKPYIPITPSVSAASQTGFGFGVDATLLKNSSLQIFVTVLLDIITVIPALFIYLYMPGIKDMSNKPTAILIVSLITFIISLFAWWLIGGMFACGGSRRPTKRFMYAFPRAMFSTILAVIAMSIARDME